MCSLSRDLKDGKEFGWEFLTNLALGLASLYGSLKPCMQELVRIEEIKKREKEKEKGRDIGGKETGHCILPAPCHISKYIVDINLKQS